MNSWKVVLATVVIFAAGVVTGGMLVARTQQLGARGARINPRPTFSRPPVPNNDAPADPRPQTSPIPNFQQQARIELLRRIGREMTLTSGQREKIEAIIREGQERTREIMQPVQPQLGREMRATQERIREILTEEQRERFDELLKQRPQRRPEDQAPAERRPREPRRQLPADSGETPNQPENTPR